MVKRLPAWKRVLLIAYHLFRAASSTRQSSRYLHMSKVIYHAQKLLFPSKSRRRKKSK